MDLKSANVKWLCIILYSGNCLYFSKVSSHCSSFIGGMLPMMSFHSTIDRPECVSRVMPPIITMAAIKKQPVNNQMIIDLFEF